MTKRQFGIYLPALITFLISNFIRYQPWAGDNNKIFYTAWIPFVVTIPLMFLMNMRIVCQVDIFMMTYFF